MSRMNSYLKKVRALLPLGTLLVGVGLGAIFFGGDESSSPPDPTEDTRSADTVWTCSMHPQIRQSEPGQCPICGMALISASNEGGTDDLTSAQLVLSKRARTLARIRTTEVQRQSKLKSEIRLLGRVETDETTRKTVTAWTGGRIDRLHVNVTGERVRRGQVIATLYSPEIFSAHQDLIVARAQIKELVKSGPQTQDAAQATLDAARDRLRLLGVPEDTLARLESEKRPTTAINIRTPFSGTVIERVATEGSYVSTGAPLYRIANLNALWVQLEAYESDLARIAVGQKVRMTVEAIPGEEFIGRVAFVDPTLDPKRRIAQVRVEVDNRSGRLRPGMFATAVVKGDSLTPGESPLVIPATAPLFTGRRAVVYVEIQHSDRIVYEARTVRLGPRLEDMYPVVAGVSEGERVVSKGAFALDADLQIRGGSSMMTGDESVATPLIQLSKDERVLIAPVVLAYLEIQEALAKDELVGAQTGAKGLAASSSVDFGSRVSKQQAWDEVASPLRDHSEHIARSADLEGARAGFEALSQVLRDLLQVFGNPLVEDLSLAFCPMAQGSDGAAWIQRGKRVENAYFGASMKTCGEITEVIGAGQHMGDGRHRESRARSTSVQGHQH